MCRSIKQLRVPNEHPSDDEIHAAALQFVRKVSGFRKPSRTNEAAFEAAVAEIAATTRSLLDTMVVPKSNSTKVVDVCDPVLV